MADVVASQTLLDGERLFIGKFTNISDGTGETNVVKVDVSTLAKNAAGNACTGVKINKIWISTHGLEIRVLWAATSPVVAWIIPQNNIYEIDFSSFGGLTNNAGAGVTGDISFTTSDQTAGDMYAIVIECLKTYAAA
jgi:hypothetical protein